MISDAPVRWGASLALLLLLFLPLHHPLADDIAASSSRSLSPHCLNCAAALTAPLRTFAQQQPADVCGVDRGSCSSRPGGLTTINWTCATVHPSISAPLPVLMLLDPPRAALDRVPFAARHRFSFSGVLFFKESRQKFDITIFAFTHSYYYCHYYFLHLLVTAKEWRGCLPGAFTSLGRSRFIPLSASFSILIQYSPILLSAAFTVTFHHICGRGPSRASLRFPTLIYDLFLSSQICIVPISLIPLSFPSSLYLLLYLFYKDFYYRLWAHKNDDIRWNRYKTRCGYF